jgi:hypothetical protein
MRIQPEPTDAVEFVTVVNQVIDGLLHRHAPESLFVLQIDTWFGQKWLGFSGVPLLGIAAWYKKLRIPPFVPNRVISQRKFQAPFYEEIDSGNPLHRSVSGRVALGRKVSEVAPGALLIWYSGNSKNTGRGSLMAYIPESDSYRSWYAQWQNANHWHVVQTDGIKLPDLEKLMELPKQNAMLAG